MTDRLRGKTAFITGAASGIGRASALPFAAAADRYGPPDVLHNCAGGSTDDDAAVGELSVETLDHVLRVDLRSVVLCSRSLRRWP